MTSVEQLKGLLYSPKVACHPNSKKDILILGRPINLNDLQCSLFLRRPINLNDLQCSLFLRRLYKSVKENKKQKTKICFLHLPSSLSAAGWLSFSPPEKERYSRFLRFSLFNDIAVL